MFFFEHDFKKNLALLKLLGHDYVQDRLLCLPGKSRTIERNRIVLWNC